MLHQPRLDRRDDPYAHNNETANRYAEEVSLIFSSGDPALENIFSEACRPSRRELLPTIAALAESQQR